MQCSIKLFCRIGDAAIIGVCGTICDAVRMSIVHAKMTALLIGALVYWLAICWLSGVAEPWDARDYWRIWYMLSLGMSALAGYMLDRRGWTAGAVLTFAQFPVMWLMTGAMPVLGVSLPMLGLLALPAMVLSASTGWLAARRRTR